MNKISKYFSWNEALWLNKWGRLATEEDGLTDDIKSNLERLFHRMDFIREAVGSPIIVHVAYRPQKYNELVAGAPKSSHMKGMACDFHVKGQDCDAVRKLILEKNLLATHGLRMEDNPGSNWIHIDTRFPSKGGRFFKP